MVSQAFGLGEFGVAGGNDAVLKAVALGSCIALCAWDPRRRIGGVAHIVLPDSSIDARRAARSPGYFADTAVPALIRLLARHGSNPNGRGLMLKIAGGAAVLKGVDSFEVGKRNILAVKKTLWKARLGILGEDVGGTVRRTVQLTPGDGAVMVFAPNRSPLKL